MNFELDIEKLNELGQLSVPLLRRVHKITEMDALKRMKRIAKDYKNVYWTEDGKRIYIEGRIEPPIVKPKRIRPYIRKPSRWKDVRKP